MRDPTAMPELGETLGLDYPHSLRPLGPASVVVEAAGRGPRPRISLSGIHLRAGKKYTIRVVPPVTDNGDPVKVEGLDAEEHIKGIGAPAEEKRADGRRGYRLTFSTSRLFRPFPVSTTVSIRFRHGEWGHFTHELPLVVWPSWSNQFLWAFGTIFLGLCVSRLGPLFLTEAGHLRPAAEVWQLLLDNGEFFGIALAITVGGALSCRLLGWGYHLFSRVD